MFGLLPTLEGVLNPMTHRFITWKIVVDLLMRDEHHGNDVALKLRNDVRCSTCQDEHVAKSLVVWLDVAMWISLASDHPPGWVLSYASIQLDPVMLVDEVRHMLLDMRDDRGISCIWCMELPMYLAMILDGRQSLLLHDVADVTEWALR